jgi:hypothetical protein
MIGGSSAVTGSNLLSSQAGLGKSASRRATSSCEAAARLRVCSSDWLRLPRQSCNVARAADAGDRVSTRYRSSEANAKAGFDAHERGCPNVVAGPVSKAARLPNGSPVRLPAEVQSCRGESTEQRDGGG